MSNKQALTNNMLGLFIINTHHELLLHKRNVPNYQVPFVWEPPLLEYNQELSTRETAQIYLTNLGLDCDLYEAFTPTTAQQHQVQPFLGGCIVIALHKTTELPLHFATDDFKWMPLEHFLRDIHEKPINYATWLKKIVDGVSLYLKNLLQEKHESTKHNPQWNTP